VQDRPTDDLDVAGTESGAESGAEDRHAQVLGERLRLVRVQQGRSLQDVEALSEGELKASVVGAYERGERAVSIRRLEQLATFYRVPVLELLPRRTSPPTVPVDDPELRVVIDLAALEANRDGQPALSRFVEAIRSRRGDFGRVLTVRRADLDTIAAICDLTPTELRTQLHEVGIVR
jgi:transcriptional regulator with XRE-family HTH domain